MPLYEYRCEAGHVVEHYVARAADALADRACAVCACPAVRLMPLPNMLQYFSEANGRVIQNLDPGVTVHSHAAHQALMKAKGVEPATQWHTSGMKRTDGLKPGNVYPVKG